LRDTWKMAHNNSTALKKLPRIRPAGRSGTPASLPSIFAAPLPSCLFPAASYPLNPPLPPQSLQALAAIVRHFQESVFEFDSAFNLLSIWSSNETLTFHSRSRLLGQKLSVLFGLPASRFLLPLFRSFRSGGSKGFEFSVEFERAPRCFAVDLRRTANSRLEASRFVLRFLEPATLLHTQSDERRLAYQLLAVRSEEQRRIGRELHETTSQTLASLKMTLAEIGRLVPTGHRKLHELVRASSALAGAAVREVRFVSSFLHPPLLEETGLATAINSYSKLFAERGRIAVTVHIAEEFGRLEKQLELTIFRIVQESLTNVHRHAQASSATVRIRRQPGYVSVEVRDDGVGLGHLLSASVPSRLHGVGIAGLRERVAELHGKFDLFSSPGSGTTVRAEIPIHRKESIHDQHEVVAQEPRRKALPHSRGRRSRHRPSRHSRAS
jgi:signal transduction histidine kinase